MKKKNFNIINSRFKYPKLNLLLMTFILAYLIFSRRTYLPFQNSLLQLGYFGTFIIGMLFAYGFTAAPATAILLILSKEQNFLVAGIIAGFGALFADLLIFKFIRYYFMEEIDKLSREKIIRDFDKHTPAILKKYLLPVFAGFLIASPLPDEIGVALMASVSSISPRLFFILSYSLNTAGILVIMKIGSGL